MTNIIVQEGQSIFDIVIQHYGSLDFLVQFCFDNKIGIDTDLTAGQVVVVDETIGVKSIKEFFKLNALSANNRQWKEEVVLSDLDILRQIRDANPDSQLPALWLDSEDPYTEWEGVGWDSSKTRCFSLEVKSKAIKTLQYVNKLTALQTLYCSDSQLTTLNVTGLTALQTLSCSGNKLTTLNVTGLTALKALNCHSNLLTTLNVTGLTALQTLSCSYNLLTSMPSLTAKFGIIEYNFTYNNFPTAELDRFRAMGFTDKYRLLPQNP